MKTNTKLLSNFIRDFKLENDDQSVCFKASIEFHAKGVYKKMDTEVHLVTILKTGLSVLYLLDPAVMQNQVPDTIPYIEQLFSYKENEFLSIQGTDGHYGPYTLNIFPLEKNCYPETLDEIRKKENN